MLTLQPSSSPKSNGGSSPSSSHQPTNAYTAGLPAPPRILIPPPSMSLNSTAQYPSTIGGAQQQSLQDLVVSTSDAILPGSLQDWKYESRREAQQILPHLYLGPLSASKDPYFLQTAGITQLLAVRSSMTRAAPKPPLEGMAIHTIDVTSNSELIAQFAKATSIIDLHYVSALPAHLAAQLTIPLDGRSLRHGGVMVGGKTLVYCESGNERSAAVVAAYVMQHLGGSAVQAIQLVQGKRFCVCFDDSMKWMLTSYEPLWTARRQSGGVQAEGGGQKAKRRYEEDEDEEGGSGKIQGQAPFLDGQDVEMA